MYWGEWNGDLSSIPGIWVKNEEGTIFGNRAQVVVAEHNESRLPDKDALPSSPISKLIGRIKNRYSKKWSYLLKNSNHSIFTPPSAEAFKACEEIREAYRPVLQEYGIPYEEFFGGSIKDDDAAALYDVVLNRRPNIAYQVGTFVGYSAMVIAHALRNRSQKGRFLITVDPEIPHRTLFNPVDVARRLAEKLDLLPYIRFIRGWNACALGDEYSEDFKRSIPIAGINAIQEAGGLVDFAFIDGEHSTMSTIADFMLLKDFLAMNGIVVFHDVFSWPAVAQAIAIILEDQHYSRKGTRAYFALDTKPGPDGLAALQRISNAHQPLCKLAVKSSEDNSALLKAFVTVPSLSFSQNVSPTDGTVYIFGELKKDNLICLECPGFYSVQRTIGVNTAEGYSEITVKLNPKE
ncbi:MAG: class I SAM-dependent methyltransferase [Pseudomonadota bacterium]